MPTEINPLAPYFIVIDRLLTNIEAPGTETENRIKSLRQISNIANSLNLLPVLPGLSSKCVKLILINRNNDSRLIIASLQCLMDTLVSCFKDTKMDVAVSQRVLGLLDHLDTLSNHPNYKVSSINSRFVVGTQFFAIQSSPKLVKTPQI